MECLTTFAACLWEPGDIIEVRLLPSKKSRWCRADELATLAPSLAEANARGDHVYAGANPRKDAGGKDAQSVALARCVFVEFDNCTVAEAGDKLREMPAPTLLLFSGGGVHAYWRLEEPLTDLADWSARQAALIAKLGSDDKIKDPPRIMRLPGFRNHRREADAKLIGAWPERVYPESEFPTNPLAGKIISPTPSTTKTPENVGRLTMQFLALGAPEGERNQRAYIAACELQGNGYAEHEAAEMVLIGARRCGLPDDEARAAVASAFKKPHGPSRAKLPDRIVGGIVPGESLAPATHVATSTPQPATQPESTGAARSGVSNVLVDWKNTDDGPVQITRYRRVSDISAALLAATGGWPKCANGLLFSVRESPPGFLPTPGSVRYFPQPVDLFAWVGEVVDPFWSRAAKVVDPEGHPRTPATKEEFHRHLRESATQRFTHVAYLPHHPPMPGVYYLPCDLPTGTGKRLAEFLAMLNPETELDRQLMLAAMLTPLWGGGYGQRPAFVFDSCHGQGSGKTQTAETIAAIFGGAFRINPREDWESVTKRLMSDRAMSQRVILYDNVKSKLAGQEFEGLITGKEISGWRPFHGNYSRPNDLTVFVTSNTARGSKDIASRAVTIHVGAPRPGVVFGGAEFVENFRAEIVADLLAFLAVRRGTVSDENRDRFGEWQHGPLAAFENADELAGLIRERRAELDSDSEEAEEIARAVAEWVAKNNPPADSDGRRKITRDQMRDLLLARKLAPEDMGKRGVYGWLCNMLGTHGPLSSLSDSKRHVDGERCWLWTEKLDIPI